MRNPSSTPHGTTAIRSHDARRDDLARDTTESGAYPIVLATYEIVCSKYEDVETGQAVKQFLKVAASEDVQAQLEDEGYIPVPEEFRQKLDTAIDAIEA